MRRFLPILFLLLLVGCTSNEVENISNEVGNKEVDRTNLFESYEQPMADSIEGYTLGLYNESDFEYERTFKLNYENTFTKSVVLGNKTPDHGNFKLLLFNHDKQIDFKVNGDLYTKGYNFDIKADSYKEIKVTLEDLDNGHHSITYLLIKDPNKVPSTYEESVSISEVYEIRVNLLKNIDNIPDARPKKVVSQISENRRVHGVIVSESKIPYKILYNNNKNQEMTATLYYGNSEEKPVDFYLVGLLDFEQIPLNKDNYIYDSLEANEEKSLEIKIDKSKLTNKKSFQVLMITSPFQPLSKDEPFIFYSSTSSNRINLDMKK
ncbi:hypothetical protein LJR015_001282 [Peribacillus frigoritolerans]|uniref:hypothetical protein n=1 Tax=Peribacillus frigoritolerans TaxID=450367 RepID=UPI003ECC7D32